LAAKAEIFFRVFTLPQVGQETFSMWVLYDRTSFSNVSPHSVQSYSKMGIQLLLVDMYVALIVGCVGGEKVTQ
jgi:hypothetical protein